MSDATGWMPPKRKHDLTECRAYLRAVLLSREASFKPYRHKRGKLICTWLPERVAECKAEILASAIEATRQGFKVTDKDVIRIVFGIYQPQDNAEGWWIFCEWSERRLLTSSWVEPQQLTGNVPAPVEGLPLFGGGALTLAECDALIALEIEDCDIVSSETIGEPCVALAIVEAT